MDTLQIVKDELERRRGSWPALCMETGLPYDWLTKLMRGTIKDPGVSKIDRLQRYFAAHPIIDPAQDSTHGAAGSEAAA